MTLTRTPAFTTTVQVYRLEYHDITANHYKQWTAIVGGGRVLFGWGRIGAKYQWKADSGSAGIAQRKIAEKTAKGYDLKWKGDLTIPEEWLTATDLYGTKIVNAIDQARIEGRTTSFGTDVPDEDSTPLSNTIERCRAVVTKMADSPDSAVADFAGLVGEHEALAADLSVVENYLDTLRLMLVAHGKA